MPGKYHRAAAEARSLGWGGISAVAQATGLSDRTIRTGIRELDDPEALASSRQRRPGAGRRRREDEQPQLQDALESLVDSTTRGDANRDLEISIQNDLRGCLASALFGDQGSEPMEGPLGVTLYNLQHRGELTALVFGPRVPVRRLQQYHSRASGVIRAIRSSGWRQR